MRFPIGGTVREPKGRTVETTVPTVTVWMKEEKMKKIVFLLGMIMSTQLAGAEGTGKKHGTNNAEHESVSNDTPITLQEVSVSVNFSKEETTPLNLTTITPRDIRLHAAAPNYVEMMQGVPGVYATSTTGNYGDASLNMRGFKQENIGIMLNGIPIQGLTSGSMYWSNWMGLADATYAVQIQKGIGGSMLADTSMGGLVNIITKTGRENPEGSFGLTTTEYGLTKGVLNYSSGRLAGNWNVDAMLSYTKGHGFVEVSDVQTLSYMLSISKKLNTANTIIFTALGSPEEHDQRNTELSADEVSRYGRGYSKNWGLLYGKKYSIGRNHYYKPYFTVQHLLDGERFSMKNSLYMAVADGGGRSTYGKHGAKSIIAHQTVDGHIDFNSVIEENRNNATAEGNASKNILIDYLSGHTQAGAIISGDYKLTDETTLSAGAQYQYYGTWSKMKVLDLLGGDYWYDSATKKNVVTGDYTGARYGRTTHHASAFIQGKYNNRSLSATLGAAVFNGNYRRHNDITNERSAWAHGWGGSIKVGVLYHLMHQTFSTPSVDIFANAGYSNRLPYAGVYLSSSNLSITKDVTNEKNLLGEVGIRASWSGGGLEASAYIASWKDKTLTVSIAKRANETAEKYQITGLNALHKGIELSAHQQVTDWLKLKAYAMIASWKWKSNGAAIIYDSYSGESLKEYSIHSNGLHVSDAPQTQFGAQADIRLYKGIYLHAGWQHNARMYADFKPSSRTSADKRDAYRLPSYNLVDATLGWEGHLSANVRLNVFATFNNLLDATYIERGTDGVDHDLASFRGYWGAPRTVALGTRVTF